MTLNDKLVTMARGMLTITHIWKNGFAGETQDYKIEYAKGGRAISAFSKNKSGHIAFESLWKFDISKEVRKYTPFPYEKALKIMEEI